MNFRLFFLFVKTFFVILLSFFECFLLNLYPSFLVDDEPESDLIQIGPHVIVIQDVRFGSEELDKGFLKDVISQMFIATDLKNIEPERPGMFLVEILPNLLPILFCQDKRPF